MSIVLTYDDTLARVLIVGGGLGINAGFETDTTGWSVTGGTIARSTAFAHSGAASMLLTPDGVTGVPFAAMTNATAPAVTVGASYTAAGWFYAPVALTGVSIAMVWRTAADAVVSTVASATTALAAGTWVQYSHTAVAPATAAKVELRARIHNTPPASSPMYIDDIRVVPTGGTATVQRSTGGIIWDTVRGGSALPAGAAEISDYEFVNAVENLYRIVYANSSGVTVFTTPAAAITPDIGRRVILKSIIRPFLNQAAFTTDNISGPSRAARNAVHYVINRSLPVATTDFRQAKTMSIEVNVETQAERNALDYLLSSGDVLFVHTPLDFGVPSFYAVVGDTDEQRTGTGTPMRNFSLPLTEVAAPGPDIVGSTTTWADVVANYATWADLIADKATWADVLRRIADPSTVVVP